MRRKFGRNRKSGNRSDISLPIPRTTKRSKGKSKRGKAKKAIKITGLDLLHNETLLSTSTPGNILHNFC